MKKIGFIVIIIALGIEPAHSQVSLSGGINYGEYKMSDLKNLQRTIQDILPVKANDVEEFPGNIGYDAKFAVFFSPRFSLGVKGSVNTARGHINYGDNSGQIELNQKAKLEQIGIDAEYYFVSLANASKWQPFLSIYFGMGRTTVVMEEKLLLSAQVFPNRLTFESENVLILPALGIRHSFGRTFFITASAGYLIDDKKELHLKSNEDVSIIDIVNGGDPVSADWSGFRVSATAGLKIGRFKYSVR